MVLSYSRESTVKKRRWIFNLFNDYIKYFFKEQDENCNVNLVGNEPH